MRKITCLLSLIFCILSFASCTTVMPYYRYEANITGIKEPPDIQVWLKAFDEVATIEITLPAGYQIVTYSPERKRHFLGERILSEGGRLDNQPVQVADGGVKIGGINLCAADVVVKATDYTDYAHPVGKPGTPGALIKITSPTLTRSYRGALRIKADNNRIMLANILDIESYLYGVVGSEMDSRYPPYALAAQAIASRTVAFFRIKEGYQRRLAADKEAAPAPDFDLTDDVYSQVYRGEERADKPSIEAVNQTRGVVMEFNGKIFYAIFHDTCGGATESGKLIFNLTPIAPLSGRTCGFCTHSRFYQWQASFTEAEIIQALKLPASSVGGEGCSYIESITPRERAPGGHIISLGVKVSDRPAEFVFDAQKFRISLDANKLRSSFFEVMREGNNFKFTGHGWGHGVGMCQEGANGMSLKEFDTLQILEYYYPESRVVKIY